MDRQTSKDLIRTMINEVFNAGRIDRLPEFFAAGMQLRA